MPAPEPGPIHVTVEGRSAEPADGIDGGPVHAVPHGAAKPHLTCQARECLALARQLVGELDDGSAADRDAMTQSLDKLEAGIAAMEDATLQVDRLLTAAPSLPPGVRSFNLFDRLMGRHELRLKAACRATCDALRALEHAVNTISQQRGASQLGGSQEAASAPSEGGSSVDAKSGTANILALRHVIAAVKGILLMIMARLLAPERLSSSIASPPAPFGSHPQATGEAESATAVGAEPGAGPVDRAASILRDVRQECDDMLRQLRDEGPGEDPDSSVLDEGGGAHHPGEADAQFLSFIALFELMDLIRHNPPPRAWTRHEARLLPMAMGPVPSHRPERLGRALKVLIDGYQQDQQAALLELHGMAFPKASPAVAEPAAGSSDEAAEPAAMPGPGTEPPASRASRMPPRSWVTCTWQLAWSAAAACLSWGREY